MAGSHSHSHAVAGLDVSVDRAPRWVLLVFIGLAAIATVVGLVVLWPSSDDVPDKVPYAYPGVTNVEATVVSVGEACPVIVMDPLAPTDQPRQEMPKGCNELVVSVEGADQAIQVPPYVARSGLVADDDVVLQRIPAGQGEPAAYAFVRAERHFPLGVMTLLFVVVVAVVARLRGVLALVGLVLAGFVVAKFMLPALLAGESGIGVALVGSTAIMFVVLYLAHGPSIRTSTALAGTLIGIGITATIGLWGVGATRLSGISDDTGEMLMLYANDLNYQGLLTSAIIVAGLGVLNDVTITQSSAVWELRAAAPEMTRAQLFASGMRIGRDHIASTIYTIVFAYAGTALALLMLLSLYDRSLLDTLGGDPIAEEIVRTLASAIGLVLAVPVTTAIAALTVSGPRSV